MDIHKPKPWRGVREFAKEIGTIVIGVLIALGAEAVAENLHERRLSSEAHDAVRAELNINITNLARRQRTEPCIARRLDEIADLLDRAEAGGVFTPPPRISSPYWGTIFTQRWQAATAGGRTSLFSSEDQRAFGRVYAQLGVLAQDQDEEVRAWERLSAISDMRRLTPEMIYDQRVALQQARNRDDFVAADLRTARFYAEKVGVKGDARLFFAPGGEGDEVTAICRPTGPPREVGSKAP